MPLSDKMQAVLTAVGLVFVGAAIFAPVDVGTKSVAYAVGTALIVGKEIPGTVTH